MIHRAGCPIGVAKTCCLSLIDTGCKKKLAPNQDLGYGICDMKSRKRLSGGTGFRQLGDAECE